MSDEPIPEIQFEVVRASFIFRLRSLMLGLLLSHLRGGYTVEQLAARIRVTPQKYRSIVFGPRELTICDVSDVLLSMGHELDMRAIPLPPPIAPPLEGRTAPDAEMEQA